MQKVQEQFNRVKRWLERFREIHSGREHTREPDYYEDVVYAFFQNFWSLKDWLINSGALEKTVVEDFFHSGTDMKICRDIANGSKHLTITRPSLDSKVSVSSSIYSSSIGGSSSVEVVYWINIDGRPPVDAYNLAITLVAQCEAFLKKNGLIGGL